RSVNRQLRRQRKPKVGHPPTRQLSPVKPRRRDADYRKNVAVDVVSSPDNGWIAAVFLTPDAIAQDRDRRSTFLVVGIHHHPADPGTHPKSAKKVSRNVFPIARIGLRG